MKPAFLCLVLLVAILSRQASAQCNVGVPVPVISSYSSCEITMNWNEVDHAEYYKVRYKIDGDPWTIIIDKIYGTSYTFSGLAGNVNYKMAVGAFCSSNKPSGYNTIYQTTEASSVPQSVAASLPTGNSITISWDPHCSTPAFNLQYKESSVETWNYINDISQSSFVINDLIPNTDYDFAVQGKNGLSTSPWSSIVTANSGGNSSATPLEAKPNILIYLMDDARYDPFQPNGGPSWFNTPSINRIAEEGINFKYAFPTTSQCAPSRVSYYSGLYASKHGAVNNATKHVSGIPMVSQILQDAGYYTGLIGKYGNLQGNPEGFNWWATSSGDVFVNTEYEINGKDTMLLGHITDVYKQLASTFFDSVPVGKKFLLFFNTRIPHSPTTPRDQDQSLFTNEIMPFPPNFSQYDENYPSYFYNGDAHWWTKDKQGTDQAKLQDFQCLYGAEVNMADMIDILTQKGILDSTLIIFTSDNGFLEGEHKLNAKVIAQEESIRVPLFIRYPAWFAPGQVNSSVMASNIDIPVTMLDAAGIADTFGMDGTSLRKLLNGEVKRNYFYYQYAGDDNTPPIRAVRSLQYKYVKHYCTSTTEEFYDLSNDPKENINEINNEAFEALVQTYRYALDSIKLALGDSDPELFDCSLSNPFHERESEDEQELNVNTIIVYPNPVSSYFMVDFRDTERENIQVWITNLLEEPVYYKEFPNTNSFSMSVSAKDWSRGTYFVRMKKGDRIYSSKFIVQ